MGARSGSHDAQSLPAASWTAKGYPRLAQLMGGYADVAIFRRFGTLNCLNILSLQAEILDLEDRLKDRIETDDRSSDAAVRELAEDFYALRKSDGEQKRLLKLIRPKLKEYNDVVLQLSAIEKLDRPRSSDLQTLQDWLLGEKEGNQFLKGLEIDTWDGKCQRDFLTIRNSSTNEAALPRWLNPKLLHWYYYWRPPQKVPRYIDLESGRLHDTSQSKAVRTCRIFGRVVSTVIASLVPALAILALNSVADTNYRIYMTIAFTAVLGVCLATFTNASMKEIFTATATFAAVEVVFIGSAIPNVPPGG